MKCKNCKYLGEEVEAYDEDTYEKVKTGMHTCDLIKHEECSVYPLKTDPHVVDGSGYFAALIVPNDFGCVKF